MVSYDASIIICVKNGEKFLRRQLDAVAGQKGNFSYEIIVVDNGSTDGTEKVILEWKENLPQELEVQCYSRKDLQGIPAVRNFAASQARGAIIAFCDADDEVSDTWLDAFVGRMQGRQVLAGGRIDAYDSKGNHVPGLFPHALIRTSYLPHVGNCNCAVSRELFFDIGGYDESLPRYGFEDVDFSWRVQESGYPIEYEPGALIRFQVSDSKVSLKKKFLLGKGRVLMARRYRQYDSASYTPAYCVKKISEISRNIIHQALTERKVDRRSLSMLVAATGNLYGSFYYSGKNYLPAPQLLSQKR